MPYRPERGKKSDTSQTKLKLRKRKVNKRSEASVTKGRYCVISHLLVKLIEDSGFITIIARFQLFFPFSCFLEVSVEELQVTLTRAKKVNTKILSPGKQTSCYPFNRKLKILSGLGQVKVPIDIFSYLLQTFYSPILCKRSYAELRLTRRF